MPKPFTLCIFNEKKEGFLVKHALIITKDIYAKMG